MSATTPAIGITFVLPFHPHDASGGFRVVYDYANRLAARGHRVTVLHTSERRFAGAGRMPGAWSRAALLPTLRDALRRLRTVPWFDLSPAVSVRFSLRLRPRAVPSGDAVVATACWTAPFVAALPARCGRKHYLLQHYETWSAPAPLVDATWRLPLHRMVIARWLQEVGRSLGVDCDYLPNAVDATDFAGGPALEDRPLRVATLYSPLTWKRSDLAVEVLRRVRDEVPELQAVVFGADPRPDLLPEWVEYVQDPTREVLAASVYQTSRLYLCTSEREGWHLPPAEAMAAGCAVVSTAIDGVLEYAEGVAEFCAPGDVAALTRSVVSLLQDPQRCADLAGRGRARLLEYTPEAATDRLEAALAAGTGPG